MSSNNNNQSRDLPDGCDFGPVCHRGRDQGNGQIARHPPPCQNPQLSPVYDPDNTNTWGLQPLGFSYTNSGTGFGAASNVSRSQQNSRLDPSALTFTPFYPQTSGTTPAQLTSTVQAAGNRDPSPEKSRSQSSSGRKQKIAMTARETLDKGAIEMPKNGVKPLGKKCLTCISQNGGCPGTSVVDGKCQSCRGIGAAEGKIRNKRTCLWLDRNNNVHTYKQAQAFNDTIVNIRNTTWFKALSEDQQEEVLAAAARAKMKEESYDENESEEDHNDNPLHDTIFDLPHDSRERSGREYMLVAEIAKRVIDSVGDDTLENRNLMLVEAQRQRQSVVFGGTVTDGDTRRQAEDAYGVVIACLHDTIGVTMADVQGFLPIGHRRK